MANTLRFKRGLAAGIPTGVAGEPLFTTDTFDLYIGNGTTNTRFQKYIASGASTQLLRGDGSLLTMPIVLTSPANGQVLKYNGTSWVNDSDAGITGSLTTNYLPKATGATTLGNSLVFDNGTNVLVNTTTALWSASARQTFEVNGGSQTLIALNVANTSGGYLWHSGTYLSLANTRNSYLSFVTNSLEVARFHATGNFAINSTSDSGQRLQVTGTSYFSDSVGIGTTSLTGYTIRIGKTMTGSADYYAIGNYGAIQSGVTSAAIYYDCYASTQSANFNLSQIRHYSVSSSGTFANVTAGGSVTNQYGFYVDSTLTGATNNYAYFSNIASGTGRWNLYMNGTANNYMAGSLGIGATNLTGTNLRIGKNLTGFTSSISLLNESVIQSDVQTSATYFRTIASTQAASFTLSQLFHYAALQGTFGAGSTVNNQYGFYVANLATGPLTYGFYGDVASGTDRWNLFMNGTAANYLAGNTGIGTTGATERLVVRSIGNSYASSAALSIENNTGANKTYLTNANGVFYITNSTSTDHIALYSTGNLVLSGTSDTGEKLQVNGTAKITGASSFGGNMTSTGQFLRINQNTDIYINAGYDTGYAGIQVASNHGLQFATNNSRRATITSIGNFILQTGGTINDTGELLQVTGTAKITGATAINSALTITNATGPSLKVNHTAAGHASAWLDTNEFGLLVSSASTSASHYLTNMTSGGTSRFYVRADGNVGIGTATPTARIDSVGVSGTTLIRATAADSNGNADVEIRSTGTTGASRLFFGDTAALSGSIIYNHSSDGMLFSTAAATRMTLDASGNLAVGIATASSRLHVDAAAGAAQIRISEAGTTRGFVGGANGIVTGRNGYFMVRGEAGLVLSGNGNSNDVIINPTTANVQIGGTSDTGEKLQVTGTAKITGNLFLNSNTYADGFIRTSGGSDFGTSLVLWSNISGNTFLAGFDFSINTGSNNARTTRFSVSNAGNVSMTGNLTVDTNTLFVDATNDRLGIGTATPDATLRVAGTANSTQAIFGSVDGRGLAISTSVISGTNEAGVIFNARSSVTSGTLIFQTDGTEKMLVNTSGVKVADAIAIGTTPDTNNPFKILKNLNTTVGIKFENTNTSSLAFSAVQLGTDITGGTKFTNLVYASSGISASGVYNPDGTSLINNGSGGLNFLGNPIRMYTGGSNGNLRWDLVNDGFITHYSATSPTTSATDGYRQYSADITAGNAAAHFRTENGAVIKLYQETTSVGNSIISLGGGSSVLDDTTFDGYTLRQIVKALRNQGILA
jgi:hypothetical protein